MIAPSLNIDGGEVAVAKHAFRYGRGQSLRHFGWQADQTSQEGVDAAVDDRTRAEHAVIETYTAHTLESLVKQRVELLERNCPNCFADSRKRCPSQFVRAQRSPPLVISTNI